MNGERMGKANSPWKTLSSKEVYKNPWIRVREDQVIKPDGTKGIYGVVEAKHAVFVIAINDKEQICLVNLFRYTNNKYSWEVPAGGIESPDIAENAKREFKEETGIIAQTLIKVGSFNSLNGICDDLCHTFIAKDLTTTFKNDQHEEGIEEMKFFSRKDIDSMILSGEISDSQSICALTQAMVYLESI